jgi:hypothetical protein
VTSSEYVHQETDKDFFKRKRQEAWKTSLSAQRAYGLTEAEWLSQPWHWFHGSKVYHSYADYCSD